MSLKIRIVKSTCSSLSILHLYCVLIKTHMGKSFFFSWTEALFNLGMGIFQKCCIRIFRLITFLYSNICLFKWDSMRKTLFLITKILARFLNKLMIRGYSTMFYNNVAIYCKVLFWLKTCVNNNKTYIKKKHSRSSRANRKIKQTVPITVQNVGYIYSSQPIFIVFTLFHLLILRETKISICSGESLFLCLITIRTRWQRYRVLTLCVKPLSLPKILPLWNVYMSEDNFTIR